MSVNFIARAYGIPVVEDLKSKYSNIEELVEKTKDEVDNEGYVVQFKNGHMVKIKSDWYVAIHKAKDNLLYERLVVEMIINEKIDDVLPFLVDTDRERLLKYNDEFTSWLQLKIAQLVKIVREEVVGRNLSRKEFAINIAFRFGVFKPVAFRLFDSFEPLYLNQNLHSVLLSECKSHILLQCNSNSRYAEFKKQSGFNGEW